MGQKRLSSGQKGVQTPQIQWQPTLIVHDPNPPITLEDGVAAEPDLVLAVVDAEYWDAEDFHEEIHAAQVLEVQQLQVDPPLLALDPETGFEVDLEEELKLPQPLCEDLVYGPLVDEQEIEDLEDAFAAPLVLAPPVEDLVVVVVEVDADPEGDANDGEDLAWPGSAVIEDAPAAPGQDEFIVRARRRRRR